jgi:hypothetical protein
VADELRKDPGLQVESDGGDRGEFTVLVDGREVLRKGDSLPTVEQVRQAVNDAHQLARATG